MRWFTRCGECPLCRRSIINNTSPDNENNMDDENNENNENNSTYSIITRHLAYIISNDLS